jgi:2-oxoglutarate ferredoxin oxidoreductase subunit alpha
MTNTVAVGASIRAIGGDIDAFGEVIRDDFKGPRAQIGEMNARAAALGYEFADRELGSKATFAMKSLATPIAAGKQAPMVMRGMHACALGKLKAGLHIQTYYPISPATDESVYLEGLQRGQNLLVVQCEDEIASIQMAVGAANGGARSSTSTSGPGFPLMVEGLGYASMTEVGGPVVFLWQRGGPSTGLPTRQDQGDLRFTLNPAQGDFPHIVVAPGDYQEIFDDSFESFNWADRYHLPVVVLVDKYQSTQSLTLDELKMENLVIDRGPRFQPNGHGNGSSEHEYLRYAFTESGVSPRSFPGEAGGIFWSTSDEHDPRGHITEDAENRILMMEKRMGKLDLAAREIPAERKISVIGPADADVTLVGWGSVKGTVIDVIDALAAEGVRARFVQVRLMRPFPVKEVTEALAGAKRLILVENTYSGQLGGLIREMTGIEIPQQILKYDGRPFSEEELLEAVQQALKSQEQRVHVSHLSA